MPTTKLVLVLLGVVVGGAAVVAGGADDSPGLQGLGLAIVVAAVTVAVRAVRRARQRRPPTTS